MCAIDGGLCHAWLAAIPFGGWLVAAGRCWWHSRKAGTKPQRPINPTLSLSIDSTVRSLFDGTFLESNEPDCDECGGDCYRNCQHDSNYRGSCCKRTELVEPDCELFDDTFIDALKARSLSSISRLFDDTFLESNEPDCDECGGDCTRTIMMALTPAGIRSGDPTGE